MKDIQERIEEYLPLNELERLLKYLHLNQISYEEIDYESTEFQQNVRPEKNMSVDETRKKFKRLIQSVASSSYLSTEIFIPEGRSLYIRKFPRYLKDKIHYHKDALEINVVLKGEFFQRIGGQLIRLTAGDICIVAPKVLHGTRTYDDQTVTLSLIVYQDVLKELLQNIKTEENDLLVFLTRILYGEVYHPYLVCQTGFDIDIIGMIIDLEHTQDMPGPYTDKYMETGLSLFILRLLMKHKDRILLGKLVSKQDSGIINIMEYIRSNHKTVTLESLAQTYNYSSSYLSSLIKNRYGKTFKEIVTQIKLDQAAQMILETDYSMAKIAEAAGYSDKSYFFRCFKQEYGMTPTEYKARKSRVKQQTEPQMSGEAVTSD